MKKITTNVFFPDIEAFAKDVLDVLEVEDYDVYIGLSNTGMRAAATHRVNGDENHIALNRVLYRNCITKEGHFLTGALFHFCTVIAHELIHVAQGKCGDLTMVNGKPLWKGEDYSHCSSRQTPWELEAYSRQEIIIRDLYDSVVKTLPEGLILM